MLLTWWYTFMAGYFVQDSQVSYVLTRVELLVYILNYALLERVCFPIWQIGLGYLLLLFLNRCLSPKHRMLFIRYLSLILPLLKVCEAILAKAGHKGTLVSLQRDFRDEIREAQH